MNQCEAFRALYARLVTATAGVPHTAPLVKAFASIPRERFIGPPPWQAVTPYAYVTIPSDDPVFLYQDFAVALRPKEHLNNGQPSLHARCLAALQIKPGERIIHVGAGTGYYTALLGKLTGPGGSVLAYEIDQELAARAAGNLAEYPNITVENRSGVEGPLPECDVIYVNAGATAPVEAWLDALLPGGRLLFPLTSSQGAGAMLLVTRTPQPAYAARFVGMAAFIHCQGARDEETGQRLAEAFKKLDFWHVRSLHRRGEPDATCWFAGRNWWLSTSATV